VEFQELLSEKIAELLHELSVLPYDNMHFEGPVLGWAIMTNYTAWLVIASVVVAVMWIVAANSSRKRLALAEQSGKVGDLAPTGRFVSVMEMGLEFIRDMSVDVIGEKEGKKYTGLLATFFFLILVSNLLGLIPGGKSFAGSMGGTTALALLSWLIFVWVGFAKNGFFGYFKSLIPSGVREMGLGGRILLGGFLFILEFISTFLVRPLTLAVRLFANMFAGHIVLGIFAAFVFMFWPIVQPAMEASLGSFAAGAVSMLFLIIMYAFELFVAFIQAYVFTILTAVYIQSSVHASEH
jgi:F-type H+-transporting ATPase subunit a